MSTGWDSRVTPWKVDEAEFPSLGTDPERLKFLLRYAILAPSGHNTQPWKFAVRKEGIEVFGDFARRLPVANPDDRELIMSAGAAITNLRSAAARFGYGSSVERMQAPGDSGLLARVKLEAGDEIDEGLAEIFRWIPMRHTNRLEFEERPLETRHLNTLKAVDGDLASIELLTERSAKDSVAELVALGDEKRMSDRAFRVELSQWISPNRGSRGDGITPDCLGIPGIAAWLAPWIIRMFNSGKSQAKKNGLAVRESAAVAVFHARDNTASVLETGELLERFLLAATSIGVQCSFFNLAVELDDLRAQLKAFLEFEDEPQLIVRAGYAEPARHASPRRPLESVLVR